MQQNEKFNDIFNNWLNSLTVKEYPIIRGRIINECYINSTILFNWRKGITPIPLIYFDKLNLIAGKIIFIID
ncbi:MAG: hypothetical protein WCO13_00750 [Bacteroidota bacterium]